MASFFKLLIDLGVNASGYHLGMKRAESAAEHFADVMNDKVKETLTELFGVAAVVEYTHKVLELADRIIDFSNQIDVSTKSIQEWGYAARRGGSDMETAVKFLERIAEFRERALSGDSHAQGLFQEFGIGAKDLTKTVDDLGRTIANAFKKGDVQDLIGPLKELGGKGATSLIPMFREGFDEMAEAARKAGKIIETETLVQLKQLKEELAEMLVPGKSGAGFLAGVLTQLKNMKDSVEGVGRGIGGAAYVAMHGNVGEGGKNVKDAFFEGMDSVIARRADLKKDFDAQVSALLTHGTERKAEEVLHYESMNQLKGKADGRDVQQAQTPWQKLGAAQRFNWEQSILKNIENNTRKTAENTLRTQGNAIPGGLLEGNFGAGF